MRPILVVVGGPAAGRRIPVDGAVVIGRRDADVVVPDPEMSRRHATVEPASGGGLVALDLGSTNGTWINGRRIAAATPFHPGDELRLGDTVIHLEAAQDVPQPQPPGAPAAPAAPQPPAQFGQPVPPQPVAQQPYPPAPQPPVGQPPPSPPAPQPPTAQPPPPSPPAPQPPAAQPPPPAPHPHPHPPAPGQPWPQQAAPHPGVAVGAAAPAQPFGAFAPAQPQRRRSRRRAAATRLPAGIAAVWIVLAIDALGLLIYFAAR